MALRVPHPLSTELPATQNLSTRRQKVARAWRRAAGAALDKTTLFRELLVGRGTVKVSLEIRLQSWIWRVRTLILIM